MPRILSSLVVLLYGALTVSAAESGLHISGETHHVFGGVKQGVEVRFANASDKAFEQTLYFRLFQLSTRLYTPVGQGRKWKQLNVAPDSSKADTIAIEFPAVRAPAKFKVVWFGDGEKRLGDVELTAHPANLLEPLGKLIEKREVALWDPENRLRPALEKRELNAAEIRTRWEAEDFRGKLLICVHHPQDRTRLDEKLQAFDRYKREGRSVLCLVADPLGRPPLPLVTGNRDGGMVFARLDEVNDLARADHQVRLLELVEFCRHPNPAQLLLRYENE